MLLVVSLEGYTIALGAIRRRWMLGVVTVLLGGVSANARIRSAYDGAKAYRRAHRSFWHEVPHCGLATFDSVNRIQSLSVRLARRAAVRQRFTSEAGARIRTMTSFLATDGQCYFVATLSRKLTLAALHKS